MPLTLLLWSEGGSSAICDGKVVKGGCTVGYLVLFTGKQLILCVSQ
jgi:hypothetical protein